jgi:hypothetical protein
MNLLTKLFLSPSTICRDNSDRLVEIPYKSRRVGSYLPRTIGLKALQRPITVLRYHNGENSGIIVTIERHDNELLYRLNNWAT